MARMEPDPHLKHVTLSFSERERHRGLAESRLYVLVSSQTMHCSAARAGGQSFVFGLGENTHAKTSSRQT